MHNFANSAELHKNCTVSKIDSNFTNGKEFCKKGWIYQIQQYFANGVEFHFANRGGNANHIQTFQKNRCVYKWSLFYSHELTFTSLKKISWIIITAVRPQFSYPEGFKPLKIPTNTISQIPNPLQINSQYNFQKIQPTKSHKTTNTTTPSKTKQPKAPTTKRAGAARSVHPWGADRKNAQVGRVTQLVYEK